MQGGQLVVHHQGQTKEFDFAVPNGYSLCCAAFYADCKHELRPVQQGFRLALVYNLIHAPRAPTPFLKDASEAVCGLTAAAQAWGLDEDSQDWQIYMLEHKYATPFTCIPSPPATAVAVGSLA